MTIGPLRLHPDKGGTAVATPLARKKANDHDMTSVVAGVQVQLLQEGVNNHEAFYF